MQPEKCKDNRKTRKNPEKTRKNIADTEMKKPPKDSKTTTYERQFSIVTNIS